MQYGIILSNVRSRQSVELPNREFRSDAIGKFLIEHSETAVQLSLKAAWKFFNQSVQLILRFLKGMRIEKQIPEISYVKVR